MPRRGENIRKRKDGRWEGRYLCPADQGAKSRVHSIYAKTYKEVKEKLARAKQEAGSAAGRRHPAGESGAELLFTDAAGLWLAYTMENKKYSTYIKYRQIYDKYLSDFLRGQTLDKITAEYIADYISEQAARRKGHGELSESLIKSIYCVVNRVLAYAADRHHITISPIDRKYKKSSKKEVSVFTISEQKKLMAYLDRDMDSYRFGVLLCLNSGLRLGELCALKWRDIDLENRIIYVSSTVQRLPVPEQRPEKKSRKSQKTVLMETEPKSICSKREIPINDAVYEKLKIIRQTTTGNYVIGGDKPADPRTCQKKFASYLTGADIEYRSFHTLRHTFASVCAAQGTDAKALSELLGHSNVQITLDRYVHPSMKMKRHYLNLLSVNFTGQEMGQAV